MIPCPSAQFLFLVVMFSSYPSDTLEAVLANQSTPVLVNRVSQKNQSIDLTLNKKIKPLCNRFIPRVISVVASSFFSSTRKLKLCILLLVIEDGCESTYKRNKYGSFAVQPPLFDRLFYWLCSSSPLVLYS